MVSLAPDVRVTHTFGIGFGGHFQFDRIFWVLRPGFQIRAAGRQTHRLSRIDPAPVLRQRHSVLGSGVQNCRYAIVNHARAGPATVAIRPFRCWCERDGLVAPTHQVIADGVAPVNLPPGGLERVVLVEQVVLPVHFDHAVRVVHPTAGWQEMKRGPQRINAEFLARGERVWCGARGFAAQGHVGSEDSRGGEEASAGDGAFHGFS
jgi:hypothetical protein